MSDEIVLYAEFTARAGQAETVGRLIGEYAEVVRREPGNQVFDVYRREDDGDRFFVFEVYRDQNAFDAHRGGAAGRDFNAQLEPLIVEPQSVLSMLSAVSRT